MDRLMDESVFKYFLLEHILENNQYKLLCTEVPFLSAGRFVDLLQITEENEMIAYEIKSDKDSLSRLDGQINDYLKTFDKLYLILSEKFKDCIKDLPKNVGYGFIKNGKIVIKRKAQRRKTLSKLNVSMFLWRRDLLEYQTKKIQSVSEFRKAYVEGKKLEEVKSDAINALMFRYSKLFNHFIENKHRPLIESDLKLLKRR